MKRVGRNSPCPCGSGRKFKKCHLSERRNMNRSNGNILTVPPQQAPVALQVTVQLLATGQVTVQAQGAMTQMNVNGALESARQLLLEKVKEAAQGPKVELAPPGAQIR